jgi:WD40 repeat protein
LETALEVGPALVAKDSLRQVAAGLLGDFVGNEPLDIDCSQFPKGATAVALHPSGAHVAVGFGDGAVRLFDPRTGAPSGPPLDGGSDAIGTLAFTAAGNLVAVDGRGGLYQWELGSPAPEVVPRQANLYVLAGIQDEVGLEPSPLSPNIPATAEEGPKRYCDLTADGRFALAWQGAKLVLIDVAGANVVGTFLGGPEVIEFANAAYSPQTDVLVASYRTDAGRGVLAWRSAVPQRGITVPTRVGVGYRHSLALSRPTDTSKLLAVGGDNGVEIFAYDPERLEFSHRSHSRTDAVLALDFTPDGQHLVTYEIRGRVELIRPSTGRPVAELLMDRSPGTSSHLAFSGDGQFAASFNSGAVRVWLLPSAEKLRLAGHADAVPCLTFTRDGRWLLSGSKDGLVSFWDTRTGQAARLPLEVGATIQTIALSPDNLLLATGEWDDKNGPIKIWDLATSQVVLNVAHEVGDPNRVAFSLDGGYFAAGGLRGVCLWKLHAPAKAGDPPQLEQLRCWRSNCRDLVFDDERALIWNEQLGPPPWQTVLRKWDLSARSFVPFDEPRLFQGWHTLALAPGSGQVSLVAADRHGETWDCRSGALVRRFGLARAFQTPHIALSGDGRLLAGLGKANEVALWLLTDSGGSQLFSLRPEANSVYSLAWSPSGDQLAVGLADGGIAIWNVAEVRRQLDSLGLGW